MFALPIFMPRFESNIFVKIVLKLLFFQKKAKVLSAGAQPPNPIANFWLPAWQILLLVWKT